MYDLHLHSIYSDGIVTPTDIVNSIKELKLEGFSLTDHDSIDGVKEIDTLSKSYNFDFIPGIEFGITVKGKEVHILGYFIDINNDEINKLISLAKRDRIERTDKIISKLKDLNIYINKKELKKYSKKDIISRSHIANILVDKGYCNNIKEAFIKYLGYSGLAYVGKEFSSPKKIIDIIQNSGGIAILAHPATIYDDDIVKSIINDGIDGLEIINSKHSLEDIVKYYNIANNYNLFKTCGSDCHGKLLAKYKFIGRYSQNEKMVNNMKKLHNLRINKI